jgi:homoserine kinase
LNIGEEEMSLNQHLARNNESSGLKSSCIRRRANESPAASIEAIAPATSANLGAGFDILGVALDTSFDSVHVEALERQCVKIDVEGVCAEHVPVEAEQNTAGVVGLTMLRLSDRKCGLSLRIKKGVRPGSGLGSSGASAVAAALAINELLQLKLSKDQLIEIAAKGEVASAGAAHADNVAPAMLGFFTIIRSYDPFEVVQLPSPKNVEFVVAVPEFNKNTGKMRAVLPKQVSLSDLVFNSGHAASFIAGMALNDVALMGRSMADAIVEPARAPFIPAMTEVKNAALCAGAAGAALSGAGPSILALLDAETNAAQSVAIAMRDAFEKHGFRSETIHAKPGPGAKIVRREE